MSFVNMARTASLALLASAAAAQDQDFYNRLPTTKLGCQCAQACFTNYRFYCYAEEFCHVTSKNCPGGTAKWSVSTGYYDACVFQPFQDYEGKTAAEKQALLLGKVGSDSSTSTWLGSLHILTGIVRESVKTSFDAVSDVFPHGGRPRTKYIHAVGVTGGFKFESSGGHPYTGLFQGAEHGIVRFSSANQPSSSGFTPSMGAKFLRDGRPSANFVAMYTLDGQTCDESDFFQHAWSNHIPMTDHFGLKIIAAKFWQASYCPLTVGLSDMAAASDGAAASPGSFPFQLIFKSNVNSECDCNNYASCMAHLVSIPVGTQLFEVFAVASPGAMRQSIGTMTLTSQLSTSKFGDEQLFFKHQAMEEDFAIHPEWLAGIDKKNECGMDGVSIQPPSTESGCRSPFKRFNSELDSEMLDSDVSLVASAAVSLPPSGSGRVLIAFFGMFGASVIGTGLVLKSRRRTTSPPLLEDCDVATDGN